MDDFARAAFREQEAKQILRRRVFLLHLSIYLSTNLFLVVIWALAGGGYPWFLFPIFGWGIGLVAHGVAAYLLSDPEEMVVKVAAKKAAMEAAAEEEAAAVEAEAEAAAAAEEAGVEPEAAAAEGTGDQTAEAEGSPAE